MTEIGIKIENYPHRNALGNTVDVERLKEGLAGQQHSATIWT